MSIRELLGCASMANSITQVLVLLVPSKDCKNSNATLHLQPHLIEQGVMEPVYVAGDQSLMLSTSLVQPLLDMIQGLDRTGRRRRGREVPMQTL